MPVVINEFEVVPAEAPPPKAAVPEASADKNLPPSEHELQRLVKQTMSREERVWAH